MLRLCQVAIIVLVSVGIGITLCKGLKAAYFLQMYRKKVSYFVFTILLQIGILSYFKYISVKSILSVFSIQFYSNFSYSVFLFNLKGSERD